MTDLNTRRAQLEARKAYLQSRMNEIDHELDSHDSRDWEELATEREQDEALEDLGHAAGDELRMINAALQRFDEGEYGYCVKCGSEIAPERLDVVPATPFCRACAPS